MRSLGIAALILLVASTVLAQNNPPKPVFSIQPQVQRVDLEPGAVEINTGAARVRIAYLPRLAPLPGSFPTRDWSQPPNPFALTGTQIPEKPRQIPAYLVTR